MEYATGLLVTPWTLSRAEFSWLIGRQVEADGWKEGISGESFARYCGRAECEYRKVRLALTITRRSLFRGLAPSLIRAAPAAAATFVGFEMTRGERDGVLVVLLTQGADFIIDRDLL